MSGVAVIILTHNEEVHIGRAIASVAAFATEIFVIDSGSTDRTVPIAEAAGARVLFNPWTNHATQFQWAMATAPITAGWVLRLDADEIIEPDLAERILRELPQLDADVVGVNLDRKHIFMDRWVRHGGRYPLTMLRLFRRGFGRIEQRWMDEHIVVEGGRTTHFAGGFADHNLHDLSFFTAKHNKYATLEAVEVLNQRYGLFARDERMSAESASRQASLKRWIKENVYNALPFTFSATAYFLYRYVIQLGFLDGRSGLTYHFLQGYWYRFLVGAKVMEFERGMVDCQTAPERLDRLRVLSGLKL